MTGALNGDVIFAVKVVSNSIKPVLLPSEKTASGMVRATREREKGKKALISAAVKPKYEGSLASL